MSSFDQTTLLEHHDFLRRLARGLVHDDAAADDLAQETWLRTLRVPPRHGDAPRSWLATVARNLARNTRRGEVRRRDREAQVAIAEGAPVDERADRGLELQAEVAQALDRLAEPYRTALFLRYFEDRSPAAIATELGVPLETVRSRLKRGLARLRDDLDASHQGQRSVWSLPLAAFAEPRSELAATGVTSLGTWSGGWILMSILTVCGVVTLSTLAWLGGERGAETSVGGGSEGESAIAAATREEGGPALAGPGSELAVAANSLTPESNRTPESEVVLRGRLLLPGGTPAAGVLVELEAFPVVPEDEGPRAAVEEVRSVEVRTQPDGTFALRLDLDGDHRGLVAAEPEGFVRAYWPRLVLKPGEAREIGDLELLRGGALRIALVDGEGQPLDAAGWKAGANSRAIIPGRDRPGFSKSEAFPAGATELVLQGIPPAPTNVRLSHPLFSENLQSQVVVVAGEETRVEFRYDGPAAATCLAIELRSREYSTTPETSLVRLLRSDEEPLVATRAGPFGAYYFSGLAPGAYEVECADPNYRSWRGSFATGKLHSARVVGAASLQLEVFDSASDAALEPTSLTLAPDLRRLVGGMTTQPRPFKLGVSGEAGAQLIEDLLPGDYAYTLTTAEHGERRGRIETLRAGVTTRLRLTLGERPAGFSGVVVTVGDGSPVADVALQLTRGERAGHDLGPNTQRMDKNGPVPSIFASTRTDESGHFTFADVDPGRWTLRVKQGPWFQVDRTLTYSASDAEPVRFAIPRATTVRGVVQLPDSVLPETVGIEAALEGDKGFGPAMGQFGVERVLLGEGGAFEIGPFPTGVWTLRFGLCGPSTPGPQPGMEFPGSWAEFHEHDVRVGSTEASPLALDFRNLVPAALSLDLGDEGVRSKEVTTWIWDEADPTARVRGSSGLEMSGGSSSSSNEPIDLGAFKPGTYRLAVLDRRGRWATVLPDTLRLQVATPHVVEATITLESGTLELLDADSGAPLANRDVAWEVGLPEEGFRRRRLKSWPTDGKGHSDLRIPSGSYELTVEGYAPTTIEWPPTAGGTLTARLTPGE